MLYLILKSISFQFQITVTASCARAEEQNQATEESQEAKRITKREATLIYDFNGNQMDKLFQKPKVIYRKISKVRFDNGKVKYGSPKSQYGPPRPKYKPHKSNRKPTKKNRTAKPISSSPRYGPPESRNKHIPYHSKNKSKNSNRKYRPNSRPGFGHVMKMPHYSFFVPEKAGFGEPPAHKGQRPQNSYGEPPVDSYGAPLKPGIADVYSTANSFPNFQESSYPDDSPEQNKQEQLRNHNYIDIDSDTSFALTKKEPSYSNYVTQNPKESEHDNIMVPADRPDNSRFFFRKLKPYYFAEAKILNKPWKSNKQGDAEDEIIVGGQYAEPPARSVKNRQYSAMYGEDYDDESLPALQGDVDFYGPQSAYQSSYSNYKNSNMAFSPQNLNDAFSIVDK